ncbi:MAG TPA: ABC transporter permease, partial [Vicinamibacterales bacterium]|nr:ABC transporter permease [Vicinamibacterales bacterium]
MFTDVAVWVPGEHVAGDDRQELTRSFFASSTLLAILGVQPAHGRFFRADEDEVDSGAVILSHRLWVRMFGADPDVIGGPITVSPPGATATAPERRRTIVGVLPPGFAFPGDGPDLLMPIGVHRYNGSFGNPFFMALGRLAPGVSTGAALSAAEPLVRGEEPPDRRTGRVVTLRYDRVGTGDQPLWVMFAGAALLLIVACSNVAGLLLGDARSRQHETAVRLAIGGSRMAILRQRTVEHAVLALAAGATGLLLAWWLLPALVSIAPPGLLGQQPVALDRQIAAWALAAAVVTTLLAGMVPSSAIWSSQPGDTLKRGSREATRSSRWRHRAVVAAQFSLAMVLLVGAGLFGETLRRLGHQSLGFDPAGAAVVAVQRGRPAPRVITAEERAKLLDLRRTDIAALMSYMESFDLRVMQDARDRIAALPEVTAVAMASAVPLAGDSPGSAVVRREGQAPEEGQSILALSVTEDYFRAMRIPLESGRPFEAIDQLASPSVTIISTEVERRLFDGLALGRTLMRGQAPYTVVGVAADVRYRSPVDDDVGVIYFPMRTANTARYWVVRSDGDMRALLPSLRPAIEGHESALFVTQTTALPDLVASTLVVERGRAMLSAMYGGAALLLAAVGLYGLAARLVAERRREIGIRVALGAGPRDVRRIVMADAWIIVGSG